MRERARAELLATLDFFIAWYPDQTLEHALLLFADHYNTGSIARVSGIDHVDAGWLRDLYVAWRLDDWATVGAMNVTGGEGYDEMREIDRDSKRLGDYASARVKALAASIKSKRNLSE